MKRVRFFSCLAALLAAVLLAPSCSREGGEKASPSRPGNAFRDAVLPPAERNRKPEFGGIPNFLIRKDPQTLNNLIRTGGTSKRICRYLFPPLIDIDPGKMRARPLTAAALPERSADGLVYTWRLRKGLKWHDFEKSGAFVTTRDVLFSFDMIRNEKVDAGAVGEALAGLEEIRALDDVTFQTVYNKAYFNTWYTFGREMRIMPSHLLEGVPPEKINSHPLGRNPVGFGPMRFHHWDTGREILLVRCDLNREVFPESERPWLDGIRWKVVADPSLEFTLFERGEIDIFNMTHDDLFFKGKGKRFDEIATKHTYYVPYFSYIGWNNRSFLFRDARVRRAMAHMIRRRRILETYLHGLGKVLSGPFFYFSPEYDRTIEPYPFDSDEARRLLDEAGWEDSDGNGILDRPSRDGKREFRFEMLVRPARLSFQNALYRSMIEDLKKLGIVMELRPLEWKTRLAMIKSGAFDSFALASTTDPLYEDYYAAWHSTPPGVVGDNRVGYSNARVDEILEKARTTFDDGKRGLLMHELHRILHEEQPVTPLFSPAVNAAINRRWRNVRIYQGMGVDPLEWWLPREKRTPADRVPSLQDR